MLHYFSGVLSLLLNIHEREVEAFVTATRAGVTPVCDLSLVGTVSSEPELGFTGDFIPAVIEINDKVSSDFNIS